MNGPFDNWANRRPDYSRVKREVEKVLSDNTITAPPVSPRSIAEAYGLRVSDVHFKLEHSDIAGFFDFRERMIYVNADDPFNRKTFTIAHELGHYFMHREYFEAHPDAYRVLLRRPMGAASDPLEKEANAFAAHLLVPRKFLELYYQLGSVAELARLFVVSEDVIRNRLKIEYGIGN